MNKLSFILITLVLSASALATRESDFLENTLMSRNESADVRATAAKALSQSATDSRVTRTLLNVVKDSTIESVVRIEATKSLADEAVNLRTAREFMNQFAIESDVKLKSVLVKTLYQSAEQMEVRSFLERILMQEMNEELQKAAAFALMIPAATTNSMRTVVMKLQDRRTSDAVKVELIKSLYWNTQRNVHDMLVNFALDRNEVASVRAASLRVLQNNIHDSAGRVNFLSTLASSDASTEVRKAALMALRPQMTEQDMAWFHLIKNPYTNMKRNPLED